MITDNLCEYNDKLWDRFVEYSKAASLHTTLMLNYVLHDYEWEPFAVKFQSGQAQLLVNWDT